MESFEVRGGISLSGDITPQGAKNEALQVISATLLTPEEVTISNIPNIADVNVLIELLKNIGVRIKYLEQGTVSFQAIDINFDYLSSAEFCKKAAKLRGSVMLAGPLLARFKQVVMPQPGGDKIGRRRIDTHIIGLQKMGAKFQYNSEKRCYFIDGSQLEGNYILLEEASVTGTANLIMTAVMTKGITTIFNAACEPYVVQLCRMLNRMGAKIRGLGSNLLTIEGVEALEGTEHRLLPDMIEIGSFIGLAALTNSEITIKDVQHDELGIIPDTFIRLGIQILKKGNDLIIPRQEKYTIDSFLDGSIMTISDAPWPGFTPDLISIALVTAIQAEGSVLIHQKMFESRLFFVDKLIDMGAQIILCDPHRATVIGLNRKYPLRGIRMASPDIRAGVALLIAALSASGKSIIDNIDQIDRGYQDIDKRLQNLGADIKRID
ncbi:MAG: UDP-N-acetylglucosamine 1-carboxyvinyltransferase [Bacteroidales bacterium]|jgi:UDP-N-acetylglucosamine 1-carboxyvinyltransferase|nr:UDP-N-acetylglucosamine 1-carboxyvinyltransferase [Bacteroidales bacterium]